MVVLVACPDRTSADAVLQDWVPLIASTGVELPETDAPGVADCLAGTKSEIKF